MAKPSDLLARMQSTLIEGGTPPAPAAAPPPAEPKPGQPKPRARAQATPKPDAPERKGRKTGPVRYTIVMELDLHRALRRYALDADADASEVVRVLLQLLMERPELDREVAARLSGEEVYDGVRNR
jgi:hypothetical protein